jgi:hypothetical protein
LLVPRIIILFLHLMSTSISALNLAFVPCYSNLLLRRRRWTEILRWEVLGYVLPRLLFLWSYGVFRCSILFRVIIVFRDVTYVIIILYSWHLIICEHFWPYVWNNWFWVMHTMSTWFWHKNRVWHTVEIQYCSSLGARPGLFIGAILLVSAVVIQLIPLIFSAGCTITVDTKISDLFVLAMLGRLTPKTFLLYSTQYRVSKT